MDEEGGNVTDRGALSKFSSSTWHVVCSQVLKYLLLIVRWLLFLRVRLFECCVINEECFVDAQVHWDMLCLAD